MRIVFMGSGSFAVPVVRAIRNSEEDKLVAVVTQPDRPRGRGREMAACPVRQLMAPVGMPVIVPEKIGDAEKTLAGLQPDLIVVCDYGQYIPSKILSIPPRRAINVHPSLLPKYRGAAPIPWAIANGDTMTGVTIQYVAKKMDSGDIILQQEFEIAPHDTAIDLEKKLSEAGAALLMRTLQLIRTGHVHATAQNESQATYARKLEKSDGKIDWHQPAETLRNRIRAFQPWPGSFCQTENGILKISKTRIEETGGSPGLVLNVSAEGPLIAAGTGSLRLLEVQPEGRKVMPGADYVRGSHLKVGDHLP